MRVLAGFGGAKPFNYFCYGAALSEVELDTLTGDWHLLRTDLAMDVGNSLNPAIDIGQVPSRFAALQGTAAGTSLASNGGQSLRLRYTIGEVHQNLQV